MNLTNLEFHELANEFPLLSEEETKQLSDDIKKNDLIEPIVLFEGKILDGRNRYNAMKQAGVALEPGDIELFEEKYGEEDPVVYVISKNIRRRHLTVGQRAAVAAELYKKMTKDGSKSKERTKKAAAVAGVSPASVEQAAHVEKVAPEIHKEVKAGKKTLHKAVKEAAKKASGMEHDEALQRIAEICGKPFMAAVKDEQIPALSTAKHVIEFAGLPDDTMKAVVPSLRLGWKMNRALNYVDKEITPASTIAAAIDLWIFNGSKRMEFELDGAKLTITKAAGKDGDKAGA